MIVVLVLIVFRPKIDLEELQERITGKHLWLGIGAFFFFVSIVRHLRRQLLPRLDRHEHVGNV